MREEAEEEDSEWTVVGIGSGGEEGVWKGCLDRSASILECLSCCALTASEVVELPFAARCELEGESEPRPPPSSN